MGWNTSSIVKMKGTLSIVQLSHSGVPFRGSPATVMLVGVSLYCYHLSQRRESHPLALHAFVLGSFHEKTLCLLPSKQANTLYNTAISLPHRKHVPSTSSTASYKYVAHLNYAAKHYALLSTKDNIT